MFKIFDRATYKKCNIFLLVGFFVYADINDKDKLNFISVHKTFDREIKYYDTDLTKNPLYDILDVWGSGEVLYAKYFVYGGIENDLFTEGKKMKTPYKTGYSKPIAEIEGIKKGLKRDDLFEGVGRGIITSLDSQEDSYSPTAQIW